MITNVKFSLVYLFDKRWVNIIRRNAENANFSFRRCGNMTLLKKEISICIIKKKVIKERRRVEYVHVNVTGVKDIRKISDIIFYLHYNIFPAKCRFKKLAIDSISYNFVYKKKFNFPKLKQNSIVSHNFEKFPAVFYRTSKGTSLIFRNGKILIVGCKNMPDLLECKSKVVDLLKLCK